MYNFINKIMTKKKIKMKETRTENLQENTI